MTVGVLDYGLGNVAAILNVYDSLNVHATRVNSVNSLNEVSSIIIPGVGSFDVAIDKLRSLPYFSLLEQRVLVENLPVLGICVGMQILLNSSDEGDLDGLGWIEGTVKRFDTLNTNKRLPVPHMGWNEIRQVKQCSLLDNFEAGVSFYFLHSYYVVCDDEFEIITATYGAEFCCGVAKNNIFGVQFHPEKGHSYGKKLLLNFSKLSNSPL